MISVQYIFKRVNDALSRKNQAGYSSTEDFNGDLRDTENILYEFYFKDYEINQKIADALSVFLIEPEVGFPIVNGYVFYPKDYRHPNEMVYLYKLSKPDCTSEIKEILMHKVCSVSEQVAINTAAIANIPALNSYVDISTVVNYALGFSDYISYTKEVRSYNYGAISIRARVQYTGSQAVNTPIMTDIPATFQENIIRPVIIDTTGTISIGYVRIVEGVMYVVSGFIESSTAWIEVDFNKL